MHTCVLAFQLRRLDFQSLLDHNGEEEREEKGKKLEAAVRVLV